MYIFLGMERDAKKIKKHIPRNRWAGDVHFLKQDDGIRA
jgi:hypothetical protein